jgi:hypothetical protein
MVVSNGPAPDRKSWVCQVANVNQLILSLATFQGYARCME